jgi:hypothetical protein
MSGNVTDSFFSLDCSTQKTGPTECPEMFETINQRSKIFQNSEDSNLKSFLYKSAIRLFNMDSFYLTYTVGPISVINQTDPRITSIATEGIYRTI